MQIVYRDCSSDNRVASQPDGVQRGLIGQIISRFEQRGFKLIAMKLVHATPEHLEKRMYSRDLRSIVAID